MTKKRILFVDDEINIIDGLRRMLRKHRHEWDMVFVTSGNQALEQLHQTPFDVIVTDLTMPEMSGAELLKQVVEYHPDTARIVLSGHADENNTARAAQVAHRFLSKPSDAEQIKEAIAHACSMRRSIHNDRIRGVVASCDTLPSLPELYIEVTEAAQTGDVKKIARVISHDMAMSAKILQLVNSSFFGIGRRVSSINQAVALLGLIRIKALILVEYVFRQFHIPTNIEMFSVHHLWHHSLEVAEAARLISKNENQQGDRPDQAFTAGLLHDIGKLVLATHFHEDFQTVLRIAHETQVPVYQIEMERLNVTHAEIGGYLLGLWALPARIVEAVTLHHTPNETAYSGLCALTAVHAANALLHQTKTGESMGNSEPYLPPLDENYLRKTGLDHRVKSWHELIAETAVSQTVEGDQ